MVPSVPLSFLYSICITSFILLLFLGENSNKASQARVLKRSVTRLLDDFKRHSLLGLSSTREDDAQVELAQVKFVTGLRHRRDLVGRDFHIIQIRRPTSNVTMELHLVKKTLASGDFKIVVKDGDEEIQILEGNEALSNCVFTGTIPSEPQSRAALSACGHDAGFSGLIVNREGHWMIEPHPVPDDEFQRTRTVPHILFRANEARETIRTQSDVLHVPQAELEKAAEEELAQRSRNNEIVSSSYEKPDEDYNEEETYEIVGPFIARPSGSEESQSHLPYRTFTSSSVASSSSGSNWQKNETESRKRHAAESDQKSVKTTVEIAAFADADLYTQMKIRYPKDTMHKIKDYILTMINAMDMLYEQPSLGTNLSFKLVHLEIQKAWPTKLNKHRGQAKLYLQSFCEYAGNLNVNNELWDHALMLTGADIHEGGSAATAGLAWAGTMCYRFYSCSVSEATQFGSVYIITHEIGHSMGMEHDGEGVSKTCDRDKFIMSPTTGPGKVTWSTCSSKNLQDFIKQGSSELRGKTAVAPTCLTMSSREAKAIIDYSNGTLPGQKYDAAKQCILAMGKRFTPAMKKQAPFNNICSMLYCGNKTHAVSTHPALEGTECSTGKICHGGQCVEKKV